MKIAEVIIDLTQRQIDKPFDYIIGTDIMLQAKVGCRVLVPFARGRQKGIIINIKETSEIDNLKQIIKVLTPPLLTKKQLKQVHWLRENYYCYYNSAIKAVLPREIIEDKVKRYKKIYILDKAEQGDLSGAPSQKKTWQYLLSLPGPVFLKDLCRDIGVSPSVINALAQKGYIEIRTEAVKDDPLIPLSKIITPKKLLTTNKSQNRLINFCEEKLVGQVGANILWQYGLGEEVLNVYLLVCQKACSIGKTTAIFLPEMQQVKNFAKKFYKYFPTDLAIFHSGLTSSERHHQWDKIKDGRAKVIIGTRSAVFLPFQTLDLAIVHDEENPAYLPLQHPKYKLLSVLENTLAAKGVMLISSLTPTLESYHRTLKGDYVLFKTQTPQKQDIAAEIIDMRREFAEGNVSIFGTKLQERLREVIARRKRALLFVNRRGYAPFMLCRNCGHVLRCPNCQIALTLHKKDNRLHCHQCSYKEPTGKECPSCKSKYLRTFGIGTERVAEEVKALLPKVKTFVLDSDKLARRDELQEQVEIIGRNSACVVVGTQMALKDYMPPFALVAVISGDIFLNLPHYRANEEAYNLFCYLKHMAWQGDGSFLLQTYTPKHISIKAAVKGEYKMFADNELSYRRNFKLPPFTNILVFTIAGADEAVSRESAFYLKYFVDDLAVNMSNMDILGPGHAGLYYFKGFYRWQFICRSSTKEQLDKIVEYTENTLKKLHGKGLYINLDINP